MKILVLFTGGTIGSAASDGVISLSDESRSLLLQKYREAAAKTAGSRTADGETSCGPDDIVFVTRVPYTVLSEDLSAREINLLLRALEDAVKEDFDGIIVTHGTDTLQYSAAACALRFGSRGFLPKDGVGDDENGALTDRSGGAPGTCPPILFVSSDYPLDDPRANGLANFTAAVEAIRIRAVSGVAISYRNAPEDEAVLHDPLKTMSHHETTSDLASSSAYSAAYDALPDGFAFPEHSGILTVQAGPGQAYEFGDLAAYRAVLLRPYHSATLNTASPAFRAFCRRAGEAGLPLFLSGCPARDMYETTLEYRELGIRVMLYGPFPADYMSLWAKYGY